MPEPSANETKNEFLNRCIPMLIEEGKPQDQAVAICYSIWERYQEGKKTQKEKEWQEKFDRKVKNT